MSNPSQGRLADECNAAREAYNRQRLHAMTDPATRVVILDVADKHQLSHGEVVDALAAFAQHQRAYFDSFVTARKKPII